MQTLALISFYGPVVIIMLAILAVVFSFFWVFLPLPGWMPNAMARLSIRVWRWREPSMTEKSPPIAPKTPAVSNRIASSFRGATKCVNGRNPTGC